MQSPPPQSVPTPMHRRVSNNLAPPSGPSRTGASPSSYGAMTGISFTNGGGFSFEGNRHGVPVGSGSGAQPKSYKRNVSGLSNMESPSNVFSTSINMEPGSAFSSSAQAFGLGSSMMMSSSLRRSYASAVLGRGEPMNLSSSFASMSFQPMSLGTSYSKSQVHHLMNRTDAELTKSYVCCGMTLDGLHALLEHVEDAHPAGDDSMTNGGGGGSGAAGADGSVANAIAMDMELEDIPEASGSSTRSSLSPKPTGPTYAIPPTASSSKPPTPDAEKPAAPFSSSALSISDVLRSPPVIEPSISKSSSSSSSPADGTLATPSTSKQPSPVFAPKINPTRGFLGVAQQPYSTMQQNRLDRAFNEVVAGRKEDMQPSELSDLPKAVAPGVLFASTVAGLGIPTTPPVPGGNGQTTPKEGENAKTADPPLPAPSLFSTHKPWRCPNPGCNKAYKQSNGLKYHQQKGQCDFAIHEAVDLGLSIEEAEERNRPFVCAVGAGCTKRYRQMNGLKYHYLNSGEHGQYGLRMLQNGTHPQPPSVPAPPPKRYPPSSTSAITNSRPSAAPYHIPSQQQQQSNQPRPPIPHHTLTQNQNGQTTTPNTTPKPGMPRMGVWPSAAQASATANRLTNSTPTQPKPQVRQPIIPPITKGKDAVLYSNVGSTDPMDIMSRMD